MADDTLAQLFWSRVARGGDRPAQQFKREGRWEALTWRQLGEVVRELALGLIALGRERGDAVALLSTSRAEWVQADFAIFSAGCVTIPIYPSYPPDLVAYIVNDSGAKTLIVEDRGQQASVLEVRGRIRGLEQVVVMAGDDGRQGNDGTLGWEALRRLGRDGAERLQATLAERIASLTPADVASIVYTSGTTGPPKGVVQTHGNHVAALRALAQTLGGAEGDVHLLFLPLAHSYARMESFIGIALGFTTAFAESLDKVADNLREVRPHFIFSVPRVYEKVYARVLAGVEAGSPLKRRIFRWALGVGRQVSRRQQQRQPIPLGLALRRRIAQTLVFSKLHAALGGRLRLAGSGGAPLPREIAEFFHAAGILLLEGYGLTETCPILTSNRADNFKFGSVGLPVPGIELRIAPDGEILARGPNVATRGYFRMPEATLAAFDADGWFRTGDVGRVDPEDGYLSITARLKEMIISGGLNVYPREVELVLEEHRSVERAAVVGLPSERWGEEVVALVILAPGRVIDEEELVAHAREALAPHKRPKSILAVDELPVTVVGKLRRSALPEIAMRLRAARVSPQIGGGATP